MFSGCSRATTVRAINESDGKISQSGNAGWDQISSPAANLSDDRRERRIITTGHCCEPFTGRRSLALIQRCLPSLPRTMTGLDSGSFGEDVVAAVGDFA
jgi:hypothetical protein